MYSNDAEKIRIFFDMDGTLFKWNEVPYFEKLLEKGYFANLEPHENVIEAVNTMIPTHSHEYEIFILSAVIPESQYALEEKNQSIERFLPTVDKEHRIFCPVGENKANYVPGGIKNTDVLVDDYTLNLKHWVRSGGAGVKLLNGINDKTKTWEGAKIDKALSPDLFIYGLKYQILNSLVNKQEKSIHQRIVNAKLIQNSEVRAVAKGVPKWRR